MNILKNINKYGISEDEIENINKDIEEIKLKTKDIEFISDKYLAHIDRCVIGVDKTIEIKYIEETFLYLYKKINDFYHKYFPLNIYIGPGIRDMNSWKNIFKIPWIS